MLPFVTIRKGKRVFHLFAVEVIVLSVRSVCRFGAIFCATCSFAIWKGKKDGTPP